MGAGASDESMSGGLHSPVTIGQTSIILEQMKNSICKIKIKNVKGTGFFCSIPHGDDKLNLLITNSNILDQKIISENSEINLSLNDDEKNIKLKIDENRKIYSNKEYNITIIEIKPKEDKISNFLEIDEAILEDDYKLSNESIYIIHYPKFGKEQKASVSYGVAKEVDLINSCSTAAGSLGAPILNLSNNKVIGMNRTTNKGGSNKGVFLQYPIKEYLDNKNLIKLDLVNEAKKDNIEKDKDEKGKSAKKKKDEEEKEDKKKKDKSEEKDTDKKNKEKGESKDKNKGDEKDKGVAINKSNKKSIKSEEGNKITLKIKVDKNDIDKEIYFLDNTDIFDENLVKHFHDFLKEIDESNVELYINDEKQKFKKSHIFDKKGEYSIKLIFKTKIKDCSYMFCNCTNLTEIDLTSFDTSKVSNMSRMFYNCCNLTNIDFSSFNTSKVTDMYSMFEQCFNIESLDLSSFDIGKVSDISRMFFGCKSLKKIDLSSFEEEKISNFKGIFKDCKKLKEMKIPQNFYDKIKDEMPSNDIQLILL